MVAKAQTAQELLQELQALRIQLQEAEETLNAIRHGEVDALVVKGPEGEQVFTLQGADHPYRLMVETMSEGAGTVALDGTLIYCNQGFARMLGLPLERVIGTSITRYIVSDEIPRFQEMLQIAKSSISKGELRLQTDTGPSMHVLVSMSSTQFPDAVCVVVTDLSEHKRNEELILSQQLAKVLHEQRRELLAREQEARAEAEKANRLKDEFLTTVSHELRNPLSAILGWSNILRSRLTDQDNIDHGLEVIERNAKAQLKLIEDLLDVSRIVTGKLTVNFSELDIVKVIEAALEAAQPAAAAKHIELQSKVVCHHCEVMGDANRLQQVVANLLSNAIKFTNPGGRVEVRFERQLDRAVITVSDTGEGITAEFLPFVFDRFRQEDASTKRVQGGLGLGLAIVRNIVELHHGTVMAESPGAGQGSSFLVMLPLARTQSLTERLGSDVQSADAQSDVSLPMFNGLKILVVDDDVDGREFLRVLLLEHGATINVAATASEARQAMQKEVPHLLICDIGLPNEDGYEFVRSIRSAIESPAAKIPALALTAYASAEDEKKALSAGYQLHLAKPVEARQLLGAVSSLIRDRPTELI